MFRKKQPKIVMISSPCFMVNDDRLEQHLGLAYIASYLQGQGWQDIKILELTGVDESDFVESLTRIPRADIYGITCYSTTYLNTKKIITYLQTTYPNCYISLGGAHPSAMPQETLIDLKVDSIVTGEGELSFAEIVKKYAEGKPLKGVIVGQTVDDIDLLPFPNRDLVDLSSYSRTLYGQKTISLISSRGCKGRCVHCNSIVMGGKNLNVRYRSISNIIAEIRELKKMGYTVLRFSDDNFGANPDLKNLLLAIAKEKIKYRIFSRLEYLTADNLRLLKESGCDFISIGLESMNEANLMAIGKGKMLEHLDNLRLAKQIGITTRLSFMIGLPFDTNESIVSDFNRAKELDFDEFAIYPLIPYPGTDIWKHPERLGYEITNKNFNDYIQIGTNVSSCFALKHTDPITGYTFYPEDVMRWYQLGHEILLEKKKHISKSELAK